MSRAHYLQALFCTTNKIRMTLPMMLYTTPATIVAINNFFAELDRDLK